MLHLNFKGVPAKAYVAIQRVDATHGNPMTLYKSLGSPRYPTMKQVAALNASSALPTPEKIQLKDGQLDLSLPVNGLALIEVENMK